MSPEQEEKLVKIIDYLSARVLEQGSMSAYCFALSGAFTPDLPWQARVVMILAATYKFLKIG